MLPIQRYWTTKTIASNKSFDESLILIRTNSNDTINVNYSIKRKQSLNVLNYNSLVICLLLSLCATIGTQIVEADETINIGGLDLNSLASIASSLGSNPQIMNMVSGFLQPKGSPATGASAGPSITGAPPASSSAGALTQTGAELSGAVGEDQTPTVPVQAAPADDGSGVSSNPLKRANQAAAAVSSPSSPAPAPTPSASEPAKPSAINRAASSSTLASLMSLLPSVLPNLNLASLTSSLMSPQQSGKSGAATPVASSSGTAGPNAGGVPTAQSVINQVLTAYANGQIPSELIQMALSGKVPSQAFELALSGQVPTPLLQMILTGQVPTSTITAFLNSMQANNNQQARAASASGGPQQAGSTSVQQQGSASVAPASQPSGPFATTRTILEALFSNSGKWAPQQKAEAPSIKVPTLLGSVPIQLPTGALSNVRRFGQLVGGTITNVASMIPY